MFNPIYLTIVVFSFRANFLFLQYFTENKHKLIHTNFQDFWMTQISRKQVSPNLELFFQRAIEANQVGSDIALAVSNSYLQFNLKTTSIIHLMGVKS